MTELHEMARTLADVREDVAYIKAKIEVIPDHEARIRFIERWKYGLPATLVTAVIALAGVVVTHL